MDQHPGIQNQPVISKLKRKESVQRYGEETKENRTNRPTRNKKKQIQKIETEKSMPQTMKTRE